MSKCFLDMSHYRREPYRSKWQSYKNVKNLFLKIHRKFLRWRCAVSFLYPSKTETWKIGREKKQEKKEKDFPNGEKRNTYNCYFVQSKIKWSNLWSIYSFVNVISFRRISLQASPYSQALTGNKCLYFWTIYFTEN